MMILILKRTFKRTFKKNAETYEVEIINNKNLKDSVSVGKNHIKNLFVDL